MEIENVASSILSLQEQQTDLENSIKNILQILLRQEKQLEEQEHLIQLLESKQKLTSVGFSTFGR